MEYTDKQKTFYSELRNSGFDPDRARKIVDNAETESPKKELMADKSMDGILFGKNSMASAVGKGVKEAATGGFRQVYEDTQKYGPGPALTKSPLSLLAGAGRGVGEVAAGVAETADDLTGEVVSSAAQPYMEELGANPAVQGASQRFQDFDEQTYGVAGDVLDVLNLAGVAGAAKEAPAQSVKQSLKQSLARGGQPRSAGAAPSTGANSGSLASRMRGNDAVPDGLRRKTPEEYEQEATKAALELLQSPSKRSDRGRIAEFSNADVQAMRAIRDSDDELTRQQDLVEFFDRQSKDAVKQRDRLLRPYLTREADTSYLNDLKAEIKELRVNNDMDTAEKYAEVLKNERELFEKAAKQARGGKGTVKQLQDRIKAINTKVQKLYDEVGGRDQLQPDQKIEAQAYDLLRGNLKRQLDEIAGEEYAQAGQKASGLIDATRFAQEQRGRANKAVTEVPWDAKTNWQRLGAIKDAIPYVRDIGAEGLMKIDTKSDVLDDLVKDKVRQIRQYGQKASGGERR